MAQWVECTLALSSTGEKIFVNLDNVATMREHKQGTSIIFIGLPENNALVKESPKGILSMKEE